MKTLVQILASIVILACVAFIISTVVLAINLGFPTLTTLFMALGATVMAGYVGLIMLGILKNGEL